MIVLAIAGLVLAIVFIAVPALQRNSRDTQRRADVSALQSAVATFIGNNSGQIPDSGADLAAAASSIDFSFYNIVPPGTPAVYPTWATPGVENTIFYATDGGTYAIQAGTVKQEDFVIYVEGAICPATAAGAKALVSANLATETDTGPSRSYTILYALEGDPNWQCIDNV